MIKAVFLDFDGTIFSHKSKTIPDSAYEAIISAQSKGIKVFLSTGRHLNNFQLFNYRNIKFDGYILDTGQLLMDKDFNVMQVNYISGKNKELILDQFNKKEIPILLRGLDNEAYINYIDESTIKAFDEVDTPLPKIGTYNNEEILVATIFVKDEKEKEQVKSLYKDFNVTWWHKKSADVLSKGFDKMYGVNKLIEYYHLNKDEVLAIGDGQNDLEMISNCSNSVAMGNSIQEIKDAADYTTSDIDDNGLYNAFKHYNII